MPITLTFTCIENPGLPSNSSNLPNATSNPSKNLTIFISDAMEQPASTNGVSSQAEKMHRLYIYKFDGNGTDISKYILQMPNNNFSITDTDNNPIDFVTGASAPLKVQPDDKFGYYNVSYKESDYTLNLSDLFKPNSKYTFTFSSSTQPVQSRSSQAQPAQAQSSQSSQQADQSQAEDDSALYAGGGLVIVCSIICCICIIIGVVLFMYNKKKPSRKGGYFILND
jgi:hypothetical protein